MARRKATWDEVAAEARRQTLRGDALWQVLRDFVELRPYLTVAPEEYQENKVRHVLRASLHGVERADGGFILVTKESQGQTEMVTATYLEDWEADVKRAVILGSPSEEREAWARLFFAVTREKRAYWDRKEREKGEPTLLTAVKAIAAFHGGEAAVKDRPAATNLKDGDYDLTEGKAWLRVKRFAIRVAATDEGAVIDVYKDGSEMDDAIASCYAFDSEVEAEKGGRA